ncbi:MraY family glycosyltransferase [Variovorax terrae]|uniref:Glycosyltransferase n=1 Tax=Variovorax terrae TaxID=2923278 RepID=A0A9X1VW37_9BURK|nr:glycosyltransferase [Variovorax terrae]MCJ0764319.1 glycosyltransferase [Variovorax terrae]
MSLSFFFYAFAGAFLTSLILVLTQRWHGHYSMDSNFGVQKLHTAPTPRIGGVGIMVGLLAAYCLATPAVEAILHPMLVAGLPAFAAGLYEDLTKKVGVLPRLLATMCSGVLAWAITGVAMRNTGLSGVDALLAFTPLAVLFTAFAVGGVANAVNIIDGFNGLAAGAVAIMLAALGLIALQVDDTALATVAFAAAAVSLGFGAVNWPFGKIFLGDGGAYLLGFILAWLAVLLPMRHPEINAWTTLLVCAYPVIEVMFSVRRRMRRKGHHPGEPDRAHLHHFLHRRIVCLAFPKLDRVLQNGLTSPLAWLCAALPSAWAIVFFDNTPALITGACLAAFSYAALYARLTQFRWCFAPHTMASPGSKTASNTSN